MPPEERITMLLQRWKQGETVGDALRTCRRKAEYVAAEGKNEFGECWRLLVAELMSREKHAAVARREVQAGWRQLKQNHLEHFRDFHQRWDACYVELLRFMPTLQDHELLLKYFDAIAEECAKHLEKHVKPGSFEEAKLAALEGQAIEDAYGKQTGNLGGRQRQVFDEVDGDVDGNQQRATWDNQRELMNTPLDKDSKGPKSCLKCDGIGHDKSTCPSFAAAKDANFKPNPAKDNLCGLCKGKDHFAKHHRQSIPPSNTNRAAAISGAETRECKAWATGVCKYGKTCKFKHDPAKQHRDGPVKSSNGLPPRDKDSKDCWFWICFGSCKWGAECRREHDPHKKGTQKPGPKQNQQREDQPAAGAASIDESLLVQTGNRRVTVLNGEESQVHVGSRQVAVSDCSRLQPSCGAEAPAPSPHCWKLSAVLSWMLWFPLTLWHCCVDLAEKVVLMTVQIVAACVTRMSQIICNFTRKERPRYLATNFRISARWKAKHFQRNAKRKPSGYGLAVPCKLLTRCQLVCRDVTVAVQETCATLRAVSVRPVRIGLVTSREPAADVLNSDLLKLPYTETPPPGFHFGSDLYPRNLNYKVHIVWDGGAEGSTISDKAATKILRAQSRDPEQAAFVDLARYKVPQKFFGFAASDSLPVDVQGFLRLTAPDGQDLPEIQVRVVPGQHDDVLLSAPELDKLGWSRRRSKFRLNSCGIDIPRETVTNRTCREVDDDNVVVLLRSCCTIEPFTTQLVSCKYQGIASAVASKFDASISDTGNLDASISDTGNFDGDAWFVPSAVLASAGISIPEGFVDICASSQNVYIFNNSAETVRLSTDCKLGAVTSVAEDDEALLAAMREFFVGEMQSVVVNTDADKTVRHEAVTKKPGGTPSWRRVAKWLFLVVGLLQIDPDTAASTVDHDVQVNSTSASDPACSDWKYNSFTSPEYGCAVGVALDLQREERYSHLSESRFQKLRNVIVANAVSFYIEGAAPSTVTKYFFDIELEPGAVPVKSHLPKYSLEQARKESYHINKELALGHMRVPTEAQLSAWSTKVHIVHKKDDPMGRLICDFRPLNRSAIKKPISIVFPPSGGNRNSTLCTDLTSCLLLCSKLMTVVTSQGLRQWTVCPFGVTNGPSCYQGLMLDLFKNQVGTQLPDTVFEIFLDDGCIGTGDALSQAGWLEDEQGDVGYDHHLAMFQQVLTQAQTANLRLKLSKCFFMQYTVELLGMSVGAGTVSPDPKKVKAVSTWPRPSRREDVERFLASCSFIRQHLSPRFSEVSKPLRDTLSELHEKRSKGLIKKGSAKYQPPAAVTAEAPEWWGDEQREAFETVKQMVQHAVTLYAPDLQGAADGSNPLHLFVDACSYGVGAGLFQGVPKSASATGVEDFYALLGIEKWATKAEIEKGFQDTRRAHLRRRASAAELSQVDKARALLIDSDERKNYDELIGLASNRKSRVDLRPLGFWSRSLSAQQRNWTTWERELLAIVEGLQFFTSVTSGLHVKIHTDHLNNTVLNQQLRSPDRILRMLLKVESMCFPQFVYLPGRANVVGDALSRNPEDRDAVRDNFETGAGVPKTLFEAFKVVSDAKTSTDDADWVCDPTLTQRRLCMSADVKPEVWLEFVCSSVRVRAGVGRAVKASGFVAAVLLPSFTNDSDMDKLDGYAITGNNITIKAEIYC
ncbi:unnamed protein product [Polarella glacialis]|uniref:Reverse transcriptase n=1 Tax=Polarella glacialis TaxID=89957 RepID=A0A813HUI1_POLGL|nr:unnamed protein product [Polarella glacialis]